MLSDIFVQHYSTSTFILFAPALDVEVGRGGRFHAKIRVDEVYKQDDGEGILYKCKNLEDIRDRSNVKEDRLRTPLV